MSNPGGSVMPPSREAAPSYWCARSGAAEILGSYDGLEAWTLYAAKVLERDAQAVVSIHERLHHELQHTTPWGLITRFAADLARLDVDAPRLTRLFQFCRAEARTVHETYATLLSTGDDASALRLLDDSADYRGFYDSGRCLTCGLDWEEGRFLADALLRACMAPRHLASFRPVGFRGLRIANLNPSVVRPDKRLIAVLALDLPPLRPEGLSARSTPDELGEYFDEVAQVLTDRGLPTLRTQAVRDLVDALFDDVANLSPELRGRLELDTTRSPIEDDMDEHSRERIVLHDSGPLPLEIVSMAELGSRAADFVRMHERLGRHVALVWARADLLARQFRHPNGLDGHTGFVVALQATGYDRAGDAIARLGVFDTESPGDVVAAFSMPLVCLTTAASLVDAPSAARSDGIATIYAVADLPIVAQLTHTFQQQAHVTWTHLSLEGGRRLHVFAYKVSALPGFIWLQFTGEAGRHYVARWLRSLGDELARHDPSAFADQLVEVDVAVQHVVSAWWIIDQQGGRTHG
jgi:hypothetical protein